MVALAGWTGVATWRDCRRQRAWAATRSSTSQVDSARQMLDAGLSGPVADWLWAEIQPYYTRPLTPYASDRIYADLRIDPDDISEVAHRYQKLFRVRLGEDPVPCPADPTWAELCTSLERVGRS